MTLATARRPMTLAEILEEQLERAPMPRPRSTPAPKVDLSDWLSPAFDETTIEAIVAAIEEQSKEQHEGA